MQKYEVDAEALYHDLRDFYGTGKTSLPAQWLNAALGELDTAYVHEDYDKIIEMALDENFDMTKYYVDTTFEDDEFEPGRTYWDQMAANP